MKFLLCFALLLAHIPAQAAITLTSAGKNTNFLHERDPKALASVVQIIFRTGSLSDPKGKEGLAALAFESLLRGTKGKERKEFFAAVERLGASLSVDVASNRTILSLTSVSDNLQPAITLLAEAVLQPGLRDSEIRSLQDEKVALLQQELSNNRAMLRRIFRQALFRGTALAFPPSGTLDGMRAIQPQDVRDFLAAQIKEKNVVVAAASNHSANAIGSWVTAAFQALPAGEAPAHPEPTFAPIQARTLYVYERPGSSTTELGLGHLGIKANHPDREALSLGMYLFGEDMSSRLFQVLRAKNGWTYGAYSSFNYFELPRRHGSGFMVYAFPQAEHTEKLTLKAIELYEDFAKNGITEKELSYAKKSLGNSYAFEFSTSAKRLNNRLYALLDGAPFRSVAQYRSIINGLSRAKMKKVIAGAHQAQDLVFVTVGDPAQINSLKKSIPNLKNTITVSDPMKAF